jgi:hypothetical protein
MFWKAYFSLYCALAAFSLMGAGLRPASFTPADWFDLAVFTPVALSALGAQAFDKWVLPTTAWRVLLFGSVFWKAIALGISIPKVIARGVELNARMGLVTAELAIALGIVTAIFLAGPPLVALYLRGYPDGDLALMRLPGSKRRRQAAAKA